MSRISCSITLTSHFALHTCTPLLTSFYELTMAPPAIEVQKFNSTKKVTNSQNTNDLELDPSNKPVPSDFIGKLHSTDAVAFIKEARKRYEEGGYIWLKGLLPPTDVWKSCKDYFEFLQPSGLIKEDTNPQDGIYCGGFPDLVIPISPHSPFYFNTK